MADADVVEHPNLDLPAAPNAAPVELGPAKQPQPADQAAAVPVCEPTGTRGDYSLTKLS